MSFLIRVLINALALAAAVWIVPGIQMSPFADDSLSVGLSYGVIGVIFGLINALVRPIIALFSMPITCLTLGLFTVIINAGMLMLTSWLTQFTPVGLHVDAFWWDAIVGTIIISIVSAVLGVFVKSDNR
ncbi:phage holin family protein [Glutamicibacter endophyticus]|uniref:phage holin family protein n=1 Tax=Glutamicibacter endophyticus TaxID=1522174 RepID=UPI003AF1C35D